MLQIRLNKGSSSDSGTGAKSLPGETVNVACPDHLILADLPVAKGLGSANSNSAVKIVGRRSRRQLSERVHFCVRCDFPIAIYGRLSPCEHAFCLDCARSDSICYLCDERIQKIQTIKLMEGIFVCAAPHCLKSFLKKTDFQTHIHSNHVDLLQPNMKREEINEPGTCVSKPSLTLDPNLRGPARPSPSPSNPHPSDSEDKGRQPQPREQPPLRSPVQLKPPQWQGTPEPQPDHWPMGMQQQNPETQCDMQPAFVHFSDKQQQQQGILPDPHYEYPPMYSQPPHNFPIPANANPMILNPPPFGISPLQSDAAPPFYGAPSPSVTAAEAASDHGFSPLPGGPISFQEGYPHPRGPKNAPFEVSQGGQGLLGGPQGMAPAPPPGPPPSHLVRHKNSYFNMCNDGKDYGWQSERRE